MNLIYCTVVIYSTVHEERGSATKENSLTPKTSILISITITLGCISYLHQSSKYSSRAPEWNTYWKHWEFDNLGLGRITTYGFNVLRKIHECDFRLISIWKPSHLTFHFLCNTFQYIHCQFLSKGKENQKVRALMCTNHNVHD